jgi:hypothetical protein
VVVLTEEENFDEVAPARRRPDNGGGSIVRTMHRERERERLRAEVSMEEENSDEVALAKRQPDDGLYGDEISEREGEGGGVLRFISPPTGFQQNKK